MAPYVSWICHMCRESAICVGNPLRVMNPPHIGKHLVAPGVLYVIHKYVYIKKKKKKCVMIMNLLYVSWSWIHHICHESAMFHESGGILHHNVLWNSQNLCFAAIWQNFHQNVLTPLDWQLFKNCWIWSVESAYILACACSLRLLSTRT